MDNNYENWLVRAFWDWNIDISGFKSNVSPEDMVGIGNANASILSNKGGFTVQTGSYTAMVYDSTYIGRAEDIGIVRASGDGDMAVKIIDKKVINNNGQYDYNNYHGVMGYTVTARPTDGSSTYFESKYSHSYSGGQIQSWSVGYPGGISVTYSSSTGEIAKSSTSLLYKWDTSSGRVSN